jgi:hypothetical protein
LYILSPTISQNLYWNYENCKRITTRISVAFSLQKRKETARQTDRKEHIRLLLVQISWCVEERQTTAQTNEGTGKIDKEGKPTQSRGAQSRPGLLGRWAGSRRLARL